MSDKKEFWAGVGLVLLAMHVYVYLRIRAVVDMGWLSGLWLVWSVAIMTLPFFTRQTDRINNGARKKWSDRLGGTWQLYAFYVFVVLGVLDLLNWFTGIRLSPLPELLAALAVSAVILVFGIRQANIIQTIKIDIFTGKLPQETDRLRIVQLSDLHLGPFTGVLLLRQIMRRIREAEPDIVVITGDLADGKLKGRKRELAMLRRIKPKYGVFAVPGNHDYYDDIVETVAFMQAAGIRVLRGETVGAGGIIIAGADDLDHLEKAEWGLSKSETMLLSIPGGNRDKFVLLLRHRPVVEPGTVGLFDLQLSGHTHGGQLLPMLSSRHKIAGRSRGIKQLGGGGLYVSNGAGHVGPPVRFFAPPEITVFDLVRKDDERQ